MNGFLRIWSLRTVSVFGRPGGDLLFRRLGVSTIGAAAFHGRVRDGIGWFDGAMTTRSTKNRDSDQSGVGCWPVLVLDWGAFGSWMLGVPPCFRVRPFRFDCWSLVMAVVQVCRAISTGQLHALPHVHIRPINVVVFHGSQGRPHLKEGFPLRCFQRLSRPTIATRHCGWRHNRSTRGSSTPVLSY